MKRANDIRAQYQLAMDEEGILLAASHILERRLHRQGAITDPASASSYLTAAARTWITKCLARCF